MPKIMERHRLVVGVGEALAESFPRQVARRIEPPPLHVAVRERHAMSGSEDRGVVPWVPRRKPTSGEERGYVVSQRNAPPALRRLGFFQAPVSRQLLANVQDGRPIVGRLYVLPAEP
jgi:hypothetical protein